MQFGNGHEDKRTFSSAELARAFGIETKLLYYILGRAGVKKYTPHALYTWEDYEKAKQYLETHPRTIATAPVDESPESHPLVTNKKWLKLSCFPTKEEITPKCFNED